MSVRLDAQEGGKFVKVIVSGRLSAADYETFVPEVERLIDSQGKIRVLFEMQDFHGWDAGALWEDVKFDVRHFRDIERLAMVGDRRWEKGMSIFCKPFTTAAIRYFDRNDRNEAEAWLMSE